MPTEKQLEANRRNAQKSTGPRTSQGKAITRLNAVKHALTGQLTLVAPGQYEAYAAVEHRMLASLAPVGEQELQLASRMIRDTWRLARAAACEDNVFALELGKDDSNIIVTENGDPSRDAHLHAIITDARTWASKRRDFQNATLYEQRINRGLHRDYALFRALQKDRKREETNYYAKPLSAAASTAVAATAAVIGMEPPQNGSVLKVFSPPHAGPPSDPRMTPRVVDCHHPYCPPPPEIPPVSPLLAR